jgi:hypothetical protein
MFIYFFLVNIKPFIGTNLKEEQLISYSSFRNRLYHLKNIDATMKPITIIRMSTPRPFHPKLPAKPERFPASFRLKASLRFPVGFLFISSCFKFSLILSGFSLLLLIVPPPFTTSLTYYGKFMDNCILYIAALNIITIPGTLFHLSITLFS